MITGGPSAEREVSIATSKSILSVLRESGHNVKVIDPVNGDELISENEVLSLKINKEFPSSEEISYLSSEKFRIISFIPFTPMVEK